jgi:hypothetical protein
MDLSDPTLAKEYAKVSFKVDANNAVTATPIAHALTIPVTSQHKTAAKEFAGLFLNIDKKTEGFLAQSGIVGKDPTA